MSRIFIVFIWAVLMISGGMGGAADASNDLPLAAGICVTHANELIRAGKPGEAVKVLQTFQDKQNGEAHYYIDFLMGNCFMMMDKGEGRYLTPASRAYERAVTKQPDLSPAWLNLAQCRYGQGKMETAAQAFIQGYDTAEEKAAQSLYYGAACWFFAKKYQRALDTFYRLLDRHNAQVKLEYKEILVNTLFALNKNRQALPWVKELADNALGKKQKQWQEVLLYQYLTLKMDKAALDYALYLTRHDPSEPKWWKSLTHIHLGKNRLEKGLQSLIIYSFLTPLSPDETTLMADLYAACNIPLEAARYYERWVMQMNDKTTEGGEAVSKIAEKTLKIAEAYLRGGDRAGALVWADKGLAMEKDPGLLRFKADLLFRDKQYEAACKAYDQLAVFKSQEGQARLMAGYAAWNLGRLDMAAKAFGLAARHPKQTQAARTALAQIKKIQAAHPAPGLYTETKPEY